MTDFAKLVLDADTTGLKSGERDLEKMASTAAQTAQKVSASMRKLGIGLTVGVTAPLTLFGKGAFQAAVDAQELQSMFDTTFGKMSDTMNAWAQDTANAMGRSTQEIQQSAAVFQGFFKDMLPERDAAEFSKKLTVLSQDVASFKNLANDDAQRRLFAAVTGEYESLKSLGVVINDTVLKAKAMEMGFGNSTSKLTEQEKVLIRVALLQEKFADAAGDVARTSDSTANQIKRSEAAFEQLQVTVGTKLLPILTPLIEKVGTALQWFSQLPEPIQNTAVMLGLVAAAAGPLLTLFAPLIGFITSIGTTAAAAAGVTGVGGLAALKIGLITIAPYIAAFAAAGYLVYQNWDSISAALGDIGRGLGLVQTEFQVTTGTIGSSFDQLAEKAVSSSTITEDAAKRIRDGIQQMSASGAVDPALTAEITELVWQMEQAGQISGEQANEIRANILKAWSSEDVTRQKSDWEKLGEDLLAFNNFMNDFVSDMESRNARMAANSRAFWRDMWNAFDGWWTGVKEGAAAIPGEISRMADTAVATLDRMVSQIGSAITGRLGAIWNGAKAKIKEVERTFYWLAEQVVFNSHVPDMVDLVGQHMAKLDGLMVDPAVRAAQKTDAAFRELAANVGSILDRVFPRVAALRAMQNDIATINKGVESGLISADLGEQAFRRLRRAGAGLDIEGPNAAVSDSLLNTPSLVEGMEKIKTFSMIPVRRPQTVFFFFWGGFFETK